MPEVKLTKTAFIPYIDTSGTSNGENWTPQYTRIDKSTIFALALNPQTNTVNYISQELPSTEVDHYEPSLPQEIALYKGNPMYDYMIGLMLSLPVGNACVIPVLLRLGEDNKAWLIKKTTIVFGELNSVDGKLTFTLNFGGDIEKGTIANANGVPTFTPTPAANPSA